MSFGSITPKIKGASNNGIGTDFTYRQTNSPAQVFPQRHLVKLSTLNPFLFVALCRQRSSGSVPTFCALRACLLACGKMEFTVFRFFSRFFACSKRTTKPATPRRPRTLATSVSQVRLNLDLGLCKLQYKKPRSPGCSESHHLSPCKSNNQNTSEQPTNTMWSHDSLAKHQELKTNPA